MKGTVQLNISAVPNQSVEKFGYEQLSVFVKNEGEACGSNPVQGRYTIEDKYLVFSPYFPFEGGISYVVRTKQADTDSRYAYQEFQVGKKPAVDKAGVVSIYPSAAELPENLLRVYIYFNTPMKKGQALKQIQLTDAVGNVDSHAFMEFKQELWSADGKRLTILFDPGRIKRGVSTNMKLGPALLEGKRFYLCISGGWQDVYGQELSMETSKEFIVGKAYRQLISVNEWVLHKPAANSYDSLSIYFDRVMDHALAQSMIQIIDEKRTPVPGRWVILAQDQLVQFMPQYNWQNGQYQIVIDSRLEDVAGNNLQTPLDRIELKQEGNKKSNQIIDFKI
ncbi:MAG: Ig-like domain-containing protein [Chloroflexota bacterium]